MTRKRSGKNRKRIRINARYVKTGIWIWKMKKKRYDLKEDGLR
jgi:hypothetical protein